MDKNRVFTVLEIQETRDEKLIKNAYRTKLAQTNPEDNPEGFKELREAYEWAIQWIKTEEILVEEEHTPIIEWVKDVENIYRKRSTRVDLSCWKALFDREICKDFETANEIREAFLVFLMDNFRLPAEIWDLIEETFELVVGKQDLYENFPANFVDFITEPSDNKAWLDFSLFEGNDEGSIDEFIENYLALRRINDYREYDQFDDVVTQLEEMDVWHPYLEVEKIRFYLSNEGVEKALAIAEQMKAKGYQDQYVLYYIAFAHLDSKKIEEAFNETRALLEINPNHFGAKYILANCYYEQGDFEQSKSTYMELLEIDGYNETIIEGFQKANDEMKAIYEKKLAENPSDKETKLELGWCFLQNDLCQECVDLIDGMEIDEDTSYNYYNLISRAHLYLENYEEAHRNLMHWLEEIKKVQDDGTEKTRKKIRRRSLAYYLLSKCHYKFSMAREEGQAELEKCIEYLDLAIEIEENEGDRLKYMLEKAEAYIKLDEPTKAVDTCDKIVAISHNYYPAYVVRQEAYFNLRMAQEVIDDFYRAIDIYNKEAKPYILAAKVFLIYNQYEDTTNIINRAKEAEVESNELAFMELKIKVQEAEVEEAYKEIATELNQFREKIKNDPGDIEDASEILYQLALCYYNLDEYELALETIEAKLEEKFTSGAWVLKADALFAMGENEAAAREYQGLVDEYDDYTYGYYQLGKCLTHMNDNDEALKCFEKVLELEPEHGMVHDYIKEIYKNRYEEDYDLSNYNLAIEHILKQIEIDPCAYYYNELGLIYHGGYEGEKAIEAYEKGLSYDDNGMNLYLHNNMGLTYKILGKFDEAYECYQSATQYIDEEGKYLFVYRNIAIYHRIKGEYDKAIAIYRRIIEQADDSRSLQKELAELYLTKRDWDQASQVYAELYHVEESKAYAGLKSVKKILNLKEKFGRWNTALEEYKEESGQAKKDYAKYLVEIGDVNIYKGQFQEAQRCYLESIKQYPKARTPYSRLGDYYLYILDQPEKAVEYYKQAFTICESYEAEDFNYYQDDLYEDLARGYAAVGNQEMFEKNMTSLYQYVERSSGSIDGWLGDPFYRKIRLFNLISWELMLGHREKAEAYKAMMFETKSCGTCKYHQCFEYLIIEGLFMEYDKDYKGALAKYQQSLAISPDDSRTVGRVHKLQKILGEK